jgi:hypothetical protein
LSCPLVLWPSSAGCFGLTMLVDGVGDDLDVVVTMARIGVCCCEYLKVPPRVEPFSRILSLRMLFVVVVASMSILMLVGRSDSNVQTPMSVRVVAF